MIQLGVSLSLGVQGWIRSVQRVKRDDPFWKVHKHSCPHSQDVCLLLSLQLPRSRSASSSVVTCLWPEEEAQMFLRVKTFVLTHIYHLHHLRPDGGVSCDQHTEHKNKVWQTVCSRAVGHDDVCEVRTFEAVCLFLIIHHTLKNSRVNVHNVSMPNVRGGPTGHFMTCMSILVVGPLHLLC